MTALVWGHVDTAEKTNPYTFNFLKKQYQIMYHGYPPPLSPEVPPSLIFTSGKGLREGREGESRLKSGLVMREAGAVRDWWE